MARASAAPHVWALNALSVPDAAQNRAPISAERVRQIEAGAMKKLRKAIEAAA